MRVLATVLITTKNRKEELRTAVASAVAQTAKPQVLVIDDGSTDGTSAMIRAEFPQVTLVTHDHSRGLIVRRNEGAAAATGEVVFSIDDDAAFSTPHTVEQALRGFDDPRVGAVAIPFINVNQDDVLRQRAPGAGVWVTDRYIGTAHAIRRELFLQLGGYRSVFVHQGEEGDYSLRMLNAGYVVRLADADPIHHFESPKRNWKRMAYYGRRNDVLFAAWNVPQPALLPHLLGTTFNGLRYILRGGYPVQMVKGLLHGYRDALLHARERKPVSREAYRLHRQLRKAQALPLQGVEAAMKEVMAASKRSSQRSSVN